MAKLANDQETYEHYRDVLNRGSAAFDKLLWNGQFKVNIISILLKNRFGLRLKTPSCCFPVY